MTFDAVEYLNCCGESASQMAKAISPYESHAGSSSSESHL